MEWLPNRPACSFICSVGFTIVIVFATFPIIVGFGRKFDFAFAINLSFHLNYINSITIIFENFKIIEPTLFSNLAEIIVLAVWVN